MLNRSRHEFWHYFEVEQMTRILRIGGMIAEPGRRTEVRIKIAKNFDGSPLELSANIIAGRKEGKALWVLAGMHGDEVEGVQAARKLASMIEPSDLVGTLVIFPTVNATAYNARLRESPIDNKDLNRVFPGNENGSFTERLAYTLFHTFSSNATDEDVVLDLHGGGRFVMSASLIEMSETGNGLDDRQMELAETACNPWMNIIVRTGKAGPWKNLYAGTFGRELHTVKAIPCIGFEVGGLSQGNEEHIQAHLQAMLNIMSRLDMYSKHELRKAESIIKITENARVQPENRGFWKPKVKARDKVTKGQLIAIVEDSNASEIETLHSPYSGLVLYMRGNALVDPLSGNHSLRYGANVGEYP